MRLKKRGSRNFWMCLRLQTLTTGWQQLQVNDPTFCENVFRRVHCSSCAVVGPSCIIGTKYLMSLDGSKWTHDHNWIMGPVRSRGCKLSFCESLLITNVSNELGRMDIVSNIFLYRSFSGLYNHIQDKQEVQQFHCLTVDQFITLPC